MAIVVVVILEIIDIQQDDRHAGVAAPGAVDLILQNLVDQATVAKPGELVDISQVGELAAGIAQLAVAITQ